MVPRIVRTFIQYVAGVAGVGFLIWASDFVRRYAGLALDPTPLIILTMIGTAWYGGLGPGLLVCVVFEVILENGGPQYDPFRSVAVGFNRMLLFISIVLFASARKAAEYRLQKQQTVLEETVKRERAARLEAEKANSVKDEFLANVSHELRTPLNAMIGWTSVLAHHRADDTTIRRAAEIILRNARSQASIIEDILDVSRIAGGGLQIERRPVHVMPAIAEAVESVRAAAVAGGLEITTDLQQDVVVIGDARRLRQIAGNLLANAVKFTPAPGRIHVDLRRQEGYAELRVQDTGIGIDADFLPFLFERFTQTDGSMTRDRAGLGLGLAIVQHLVELHGGTVTAESEGRNKGSVFTVRLPLYSTPDEKLTQDARRSVSASPPSPAVPLAAPSSGRPRS